MSFNKHTLIRVEWKDAKSCTGLDVSEIPQSLKLAPYIAAGFKIAENKEVLVICQGIMPPLDRYEDTIYKAVLSIPKALITKIEELQVK